MRYFSAWLLSIVGAIAMSACGGGGGGSTFTPMLQSITVTPAAVTVAASATHQLQANGSYSDGSSRDVTASVTWSSSATAVATVSAGLVTGTARGAATVTAAIGSISGTSAVTVTGVWTAAAGAPLILSGPTATLLKSGKVFVMGLDPYNIGAAIYDPAADSWTMTANAPANARYAATATLLNDGRVLVAGGSTTDVVSGHTVYLSSAELYDPVTGNWSAAASMPAARKRHAAVLLADGRVMVVGGDDSGNQPLNDALLYDPAADTWTPTPAIITPGILPTATVLPNGTVFITSNVSQGSTPTEIYDPVTGMWTPGASAHSGHVLGASATLLSNGKVLLVGGQLDIQGSGMAAPELYDPTTDAWSAAGTMLAGRAGHTATLITGGQVLVAGGADNQLQEFASAETYDPATNMWSAAASMLAARVGHGAVLLPSGIVFALCGQHQGLALQSTERFH